MSEARVEGEPDGLKQAQARAEAMLTIRHPDGLHLRPAAQFVQTAAQFRSNIRLENRSRPNATEVDAKSMVGIMQSGVSAGHQIYLCAEGPDAAAAIAALQGLVERDFEGV